MKMDEVKKCDRCKCILERSIIEELIEDNKTGHSFREAIIINQRNFISGSIKSLILCPSCAEDFMLFMDNHPLAARAPEPFIPEDDPNKGYSTKNVDI